MKPTIKHTSLPGVVVVEPSVFVDGRGFFMETWNQREWAEVGLLATFVQDSHSRSTQGVLRGVHFQDLTAPMGKLIRCTAGQIFDVAVDLRVGSPTFGRWVGVELTAENKSQLYLPVGFGHGFQALSDIAEVQYKQTGYYTPSAERIVAWDDPEIGIDWPIENPVLSDRDRKGLSLRAYAERPAFRYDPVSA